MAWDFQRQLSDSHHHFSRKAGTWQRLHIDPLLLVILLALAAFGLTVLYSAAGQDIYFVKRQSVWFLISFIGMFIVAQINMQWLQRWAYWLFGGGILLLVGVLVFGVGAKGAQRWLSLGGFRFQPSEIMKLAVPMAIAAYFAPRLLPPKFKHVCGGLVLIGIPTLLIALQPDLGTSILIAASGIFVLFFAGLPWRYILGACFLAVSSAPLFWYVLLHEYQKTRIKTLFNPEADRLGAGWNIIQSKTAIGSGGVHGKGWMNGTQSHLDFLPESHTDFIIAVLAEEFGLLGVVFLLGLYIALISRGLWIGLTAKNTFSRLLAVSITLTFFIYVFVNMGMVSGILPVVGVPLPLISYGGTSVLTLMMGFGVLMAISTERER